MGRFAPRGVAPAIHLLSWRHRGARFVVGEQQARWISSSRDPGATAGNGQGQTAAMSLPFTVPESCAINAALSVVRGQHLHGGSVMYDSSLKLEKMYVPFWLFTSITARTAHFYSTRGRTISIFEQDVIRRGHLPGRAMAGIEFGESVRTYDVNVDRFLFRHVAVCAAGVEHGSSALDHDAVLKACFAETCASSVAKVQLGPTLLSHADVSPRFHASDRVWRVGVSEATASRDALHEVYDSEKERIANTKTRDTNAQCYFLGARLEIIDAKPAAQLLFLPVYVARMEAVTITKSCVLVVSGFEDAPHVSDPSVSYCLTARPAVRFTVISVPTVAGIGMIELVVWDGAVSPELLLGSLFAACFAGLAGTYFEALIESVQKLGHIQWWKLPRRPISRPRRWKSPNETGDASYGRRKRTPRPHTAQFREYQRQNQGDAKQSSSQEERWEQQRQESERMREKYEAFWGSFHEEPFGTGSHSGGSRTYRNEYTGDSYRHSRASEHTYRDEYQQHQWHQQHEHGQQDQQRHQHRARADAGEWSVERACIVLQCDSDAPLKDIKKAYLRQAMKYHPDRLGSQNGVDEHVRKSHEKRFKEISSAYGVLKRRHGRGA